MNDNPFAKFAETPAPAAEENPFAKFAQPQEPAAPGPLAKSAKFLDDIVRQLASGMTFGAADEIAAAGNAAIGRGSYDEALKAERARDAQFSSAHPYIAGGANIAGAVVSPINKLLIPGRAASLAGAMGKNAVGGAVAGGSAGFLSGEGEEDRLRQAMTGAALGGGIGAAIPAAGSAFRKAYEGALSLFGNTSTARARAERMILRDLGRDNVTPQELAEESARATAAGRPAMLADLAGANVQQSAQVLGRTPGVGQSLAAEAMRGRGSEAQANRLSEAVRGNVSGIDFREATDTLLTQRGMKASPLYAKAWQTEVPNELMEQLYPLLQSKEAQTALQRGLSQMEREGRALYLESVRGGAPDRGLLFDPASVGSHTLRLLDAVKRGFDDMLEKGDMRTQFGKLTAEGHSVESQRRHLVGILRDRFPDYRAALDAWAGPSAALDAMNLGRRIVSEGPEAFERSSRELAKLDDGGKAFARIGTARALLDRISGTTDPAELTRLNRMLGTPAVRERVRAVFGNDAQFDEFMSTWRAEMKMAQTNAAIAPRGGSPTMPMQERAADLRAPPGGSGVFVDGTNAPSIGLGEDLLRAGATGGVTAPAFRAGQRVRDAMRDRGYRANMEEMAPYLLSTDPAMREEFARRLLQRALMDKTISDAVRPVISPLTTGIPAGLAMQE